MELRIECSVQCRKQWILTAWALLAAILLTPRLAAQTNVFGGNSSGGIELEVPGTRAPVAEARPTPQAASGLRYVSLTRLLRLVHLLGSVEEAPQELRALAGLERITAVCVYPEQGEIVLAGPVRPPHGQRQDREQRWQRERETFEPAPEITRLHLLLAALHFAATSESRSLRCSIDPLAPPPVTAKAESARQVTARDVPRFVQQQSITLEGVERRSPLAHVCVLADVRLKHLALGVVPSGIAELPELMEWLPQRGEHAAPHVWIRANFPAIGRAPDERVWYLRSPEASAHAALAQSAEQLESAKVPRGVLRWAEQLTRSYAPLAAEHHVFEELQRMMNFCQAAMLVHDEVQLRRILERSTMPQLPASLFHCSRSAPSTMTTCVRQQPGGRRRSVVWGGIELDLAHATVIADDASAAAHVEPLEENAGTRGPDAWQLLGKRGQPPDEEAVWWWDSDEASPPHADREPDRPRAWFYGVPIVEHDVVFLLDKSLSMQLPSRQSGLTRWDRACVELSAALRRGFRAPPVDVIAFDEQVLSWRERLDPETEGKPRDLVRFLTALECGGDTDLEAALEWVLENYPQCRVLYVLSDGDLQTRGRRDTTRLWRMVAARQNTHPLRIVTLGVAPAPRGEAILRRLALETGGLYTRVE